MASAYLNNNGDVLTVARNADPSIEEIQNKAPDVTTKISNAPNELKPLRVNDPHPDATEYHRKTSGDGTNINHYTAIPDLDAYKARRFQLIDDRTQELIAYGFEFDGNRFSMSQPAQLTWNMLRTSLSTGVLSSTDFPRYLSTADNQTYILSNISDANGFFAAYANTVNHHLNAGRDLKSQINSATSKSEIDSIIDNRSESDSIVSTVANKRLDSSSTGYVDWRYEVVEKDNDKIESIKKYMVDNGDGTYSGLVKEDLYTYVRNRLISITTNNYDSDGNIQSTDTRTFHASRRSAIRKYS